MVRRGLLDTSAVLVMPRLERSFAELPDEGIISTVTLAELAVGPQVARTEAERAARIIEIQHAEADFEVLPFDVNAARVFGLVAADLRRAGRKPAARAFDAMIAAVAIANGLPLYTCNPADFAGIIGLEVVAVRQPDAGPA